MRVDVIEHHSGRRRSFVGPEPEVRGDLLAAYRWLLTAMGPHAAVRDLVSKLDAKQAYSAGIATVAAGLPPDWRLDLSKSERWTTPVARMLGMDKRRGQLLEAASFLAGGRVPDVGEYRRRLHHGASPEASALASVGLDPERHQAALRAVLDVTEALEKGEGSVDKPVVLGEVTGSDQGSQAFVAAATRASNAGGVHKVILGGKHSKGAMVAYDPQEHVRLLLKPSAGGESPSMGADESGASQPAREAAFHAAMDAMGLGGNVPETHVLRIHGREYAAISMLGTAWKTLDELRREDPGDAHRRLTPSLNSGRLHQLAAADGILGNVDRHAGNILMRGTDIALIDHGSAFAGKDFNPANDPDTFTPAYLRDDKEGFQEMDGENRLKALPRLSQHAAAKVGEWIQSIDAEKLAEVLKTYGIDPGPTLDRLAKLRGAVRGMSPDLAINAFWTLP